MCGISLDLLLVSRVVKRWRGCSSRLEMADEDVEDRWVGDSWHAVCLERPAGFLRVVGGVGGVGGSGGGVVL